MPRIKRGTTANKRRKNILKKAKGFKWGRKSKYKLAKDAITHAGVYSFRDRKVKKRTFRKLWQIQISAALGDMISYSKFIAQLKKYDVQIDRKILSQLGKTRPDTFKKIVERVKED